MNKFIVLYWSPGSGGDLVQQLLLSHPKKFQGVVDSFRNSDTGRIVSSIKIEFENNFSHMCDHWYLREWTNADCRKILDITKSLDCETFVIPTHRQDQVDFLMANLENCQSVGITYSINMFQCVLKNWCKKVKAIDDQRENSNKPEPQYFKNKRVFGEYMLLYYLKFGTIGANIEKSVENKFDISISLENLYNNDLSDFQNLVDIDFVTQNLYKSWLVKQNSLYKKRYSIVEELEQSLGFNSKSEKTDDLEISLDAFDNILIRHYFSKSCPYFDTLDQANIFFKS
jgi:hypothetical protein